MRECRHACRLVVVGAGYIGCKQASIYNNFGTDVHFLVRQVPQLRLHFQEKVAFKDMWCFRLVVDLMVVC